VPLDSALHKSFVREFVASFVLSSHESVFLVTSSSPL
jgi:hypothetical protein